jgi:hypothetical protein
LLKENHNAGSRAQTAHLSVCSQTNYLSAIMPPIINSSTNEPLCLSTAMPPQQTREEKSGHVRNTIPGGNYYKNIGLKSIVGFLCPIIMLLIKIVALVTKIMILILILKLVLHH